MRAFKQKIVIIDDEQDLCFLLTSMLSAYGFEVKSYGTLRSGLDGIASMKPDWVVVDNNLPDGLGWEHNPSIENASPGVNIINISANPDSARLHKGPNIHYLIKPINANSIVELISTQN
jgi:two-component system, OmpR family, response regulator